MVAEPDKAEIEALYQRMLEIVGGDPRLALMAACRELLKYEREEQRGFKRKGQR